MRGGWKIEHDYLMSLYFNRKHPAAGVFTVGLNAVKMLSKPAAVAKTGSQTWENADKSAHVSAVICAQLEIDDGDELTDEFLYDEVHPKQREHKQAFAKPRGPAGKRGHKRLIKGPAEILQDS